MLVEEFALDTTGVDFKLLTEDAALLLDREGLMEATDGAASETSQLHCDIISMSYLDQIHTYSEKLSERRVVWLARLSLDIFQILRKPESADLQHAIQWILRVPYCTESVWNIKIRPVLLCCQIITRSIIVLSSYLEVRSRLKQL